TVLVPHNDPDLVELAPNVLVPRANGDLEPRPGFRRFLRELGQTFGRTDAVAALLAIWDGRVATLARHLAGREIGVLASGGHGSPWGDGFFYPPSDTHPSQVFGALGLRVVVPGRARRTCGDAFTFDDDGVPELETDTLFFHTRRLPRDRVRALRGEIVARL